MTEARLTEIEGHLNEPASLRVIANDALELVAEVRLLREAFRGIEAELFKCLDEYDHEGGNL